jgi:hypothetical protein
MDYPKKTNPNIAPKSIITTIGANTSNVLSKYIYFFLLSLMISNFQQI